MEIRHSLNFTIMKLEFESPFVLKKNEIIEVVCMYLILGRFVTLCNLRLLEFEFPFVLEKNEIYEVICMYLTLEIIRHSLQNV